MSGDKDMNKRLYRNINEIIQLMGLTTSKNDNSSKKMEIENQILSLLLTLEWYKDEGSKRGSKRIQNIVDIHQKIINLYTKRDMTELKKLLDVDDRNFGQKPGVFKKKEGVWISLQLISALNEAYNNDPFGQQQQQQQEEEDEESVSSSEEDLTKGAAPATAAVDTEGTEGTEGAAAAAAVVEPSKEPLATSSSPGQNIPLEGGGTVLEDTKDGTRLSKSKKAKQQSKRRLKEKCVITER